MNIGLQEEVYTEREPEEVKLKVQLPYIVTLSICGRHIVVDSSEEEIDCMDAVVHFGVTSEMKVQGIEVSRGRGLNAGLFAEKHLRPALGERVKALQV